MSITRDSGDFTVGSIVSFADQQWRVLDVQNSIVLLICDRIVEVRAYHTPDQDTTWSECELRGYLNGVFLDGFGEDDKLRIAETAVITGNNPWYGTNGGSMTKDRIFLLSIEEVVKYFGNSGRLGCGPAEDEDIIGCIDDEYSPLRVACDENGIDSCWWLRSPGKYGSYSALVTDSGEISMHGPFDDHVFAFGAGVRPALWMKL